MRWYLAAAVAALALPGPAAEVEAARTIVDAQPLRERASVAIAASAQAPGGRATLVNLNPRVNAWFVLTIESAGASTAYHLENPLPDRQHLSLDAEARGLRIDGAGQASRCALWPADARSALDQAKASALPYAPLCDGRLSLRQSVRGSRSSLEATAQFLRDHVWRGEQVVGFVRREVFQDAYAERGVPASQVAAGDASVPPRNAPQSDDAPAAAALKPAYAGRTLIPASLGLAVDAGTGGALQLGRWYALPGAAGVRLSVIQAAAVAGADRAASTGAAQADPLAYLVAFDLARFELGFALGTDHPRLGWSPRVVDAQRNPALPGPDGFDSTAPLARTGVLAPSLQPRAVASFTGGFKREHGAFRFGELAQRNHGSHYGFVEQGVVFSRLQPGLATLVVADDGSIDMRTWRAGDSEASVRHARQNGVALVERDAAGGVSHIGSLVDQWGPGNWSGSSDERLRSLRAGACLIEQGARRFLVYGWFSSATPRTMAEVFLAYGCRYAMHLDMNALEHTYLAVYARRGTEIEVQHLVRGMAVLDGHSGAALLPRFLAQPDNRDFFYLLRREAAR